MRTILTAGTALALSLAIAGTASAANTDTTAFDGFDNGTVNGQHGWKAGAYDQEVVDVDGGKALRISNAVTSGSFSDMPFSAPVDPAGENAVNNVLTNEFKVRSATDVMQPGLAMSVSPTDGEGARMSYVRLEDRYDGVRVFFVDGTFAEQWIATVSRDQSHTIKFETTFVPGYDNDVVRVFIDGQQKASGQSWEHYYRFDEQREPAPSDRLMWRLSVAPANQEQRDALKGKGFIFDDVTSTSSHVDNPAPYSLPAGPAGPAGEDGKNGEDGAKGDTGATGVDGVTTVIHDAGTLAGNTMRTIHARNIKGRTFVSVRASLRGKRLHAHGRSVKVDLRGKAVGNYNVVMVAKYKTKSSGKIHTERSIRSLSILRK